MAEQGITDIFSTPDVIVSMDMNTWDEMETTLNDVKLAVGEQQVDCYYSQWCSRFTLWWNGWIYRCSSQSVFVG